MKRGLVTLARLLLVTALYSGAWAASFPMDSTYGAGARSLVFQGSFGYLSIQSGLMIFDMSDPGHPQFISRLDLPVPRPPQIQSRFTIALMGTVAYVPMELDGFYAIDVSNPDSPSILTHVLTPKRARNLVTSDGYLYAGVLDTGIMTYNLDNPDSPAFISVTPDTYITPHELEIHDGYLYLAAEDLFVYSLADPGHPIAVDTVLEPSRCSAVEAVGDHLYLADFWYPQASPHVGFETVDISDPTAPVFLYSEHLHGDDIEVLVDFPVAYVLNGGGVEHQAFDITDPAAPVAMPVFLSPTSDAMMMAKYGGCMYVVGTGGVTVMQMSLRGECNGDSAITAGDIIALVNHVFKGGPAPSPPIQGNTNCVGGTNASDVIRLVTFVFRSGSTPACL